jgi:ATP-binding cassette, subfamily B (MDR/TAP), member 1
VITHDLSQISSSDFVYLLQYGRVVEQGYRCDLEGAHGEFRRLLISQRITGGFLPTKNLDVSSEELLPPPIPHVQVETVADERRAGPVISVRGSLVQPFNALDYNWVLNTAADLATKPDLAPTIDAKPSRLLRPTSFNPLHRKPSLASKDLKLQRPASAFFSSPRPESYLSVVVEPSSPSSIAFEMESGAMQQSANHANMNRKGKGDRRRHLSISSSKEVQVSSPADASDNADSKESTSFPLLSLLKSVYPTIPHKMLFFVGLIACILSGAMTPLFSFMLSRLLFEVSIGAQNASTINILGGMVLGIAAMDGSFIAMRYMLMETSAMLWVMKLRKTCFALILKQHKKWFDKEANSVMRLVKILVKDGGDAQDFVSVVIGQFVLVFVMVSVGIIWALVTGWQLTLVGVAIAPLFAITTGVVTRLVSKCEAKNRTAKEEMGKRFYEVCILRHIH